MLYVFAQQTPEMLTGWAAGPDHDVGYRFLQLVAGFGTIAAAAYVFSRRSPFPIIAMALAGGSIAASLAIASFETTSVGPPLAGLLAVAEDTTRALGPFGNPNYLGAFSAIAVATAAGLLPGVRAPVVRLLLVAVAVVAAIAIALSLSRAAVVAVLAGLACVAWWRSRRLALALAGTAVIGVLIIYPAFLEWRLESLRGVVSTAGYAAISASDEGRLSGLLVGPQLFLSSPLFGVGFAHYEALSVEIGGVAVPINAHNWYIEVLAEQGIVGVLLWIAIAIVLVRDLWRRPPLAQVAGFSALGALAAAGLFLEAPTSYQTVALPLLVITAALVSDWRGEETAPPGRDPTAAQSPGV
jgi:O-antigen ligase